MSPAFDTLIQDFFCRRLIEQQDVSPRTIEAYRDTFRLLLAYLPHRLGKPVPSLALSDLDAPTVLAFLGHLETEAPTPLALETPAWQPCARLFSMQRLATRLHGLSLIECWPFQLSATPSRYSGT